jgi:hypothetical protein
MDTPKFLDLLQASTLSQRIAAADHLLMAGLQILHVLGFVLLLASLVLLGLRVFGIVFVTAPLDRLARDAGRCLWLGLLLTMSSGTVMFIGAPHHYVDNAAFRVKLPLLGFAILLQGAMSLQLRLAEPRLFIARVGMAASLVLWFAVSLAGRAIGFV